MMITSSQRRLAVLIVSVLTGAVGCERSLPENDTSFFFVEHAHQAEVSFHGERVGVSARRLWDQVTLGSETRRALTPPLPSRVTFDLRVPKDPVLRFAVGASTLGNPTLLAPVEFRLLVESNEREELVFTETVRRSKPNRWFTQEVDLTSWGGSRIRLSFETKRGAGGVASAESQILPLWGNPVLASRTPVATRSNLILISVDCLRADHLGAYGYERDTSPNIDEFSRNGVLFLSAVSASSFTLPTHASMLTGLPPSLHGATTRRKIAKSVPYLPKLLAEAKYRVNGIVSAPFLSRFYGFERGFHTYRNMSARAAALVDYGLALLREGGGQDQFLFLHLMDAHWPYSPPGEFITRFGERPSDISGLFERFEQGGPASRMELDQIINLYDAEIAYLDQELGRFFDELKRMKLYDNSLIILTADHGEAFYEHGHWEHARPWRNDGPGLYEEVVRIPLIIKWPRESSSLEIPNVVSQMDIFPTMLDAAGMEPLEGWATSLRRYVDGASPPPTDRKVIAEFTSYSEEAGAAMQIAFRSRDYKYIARFHSPSEEGLFSSNVEKEELYDLRNDPRETANLLVDSDRGSGPYREALRAYLAELRRSRPNLQGEAVTVDDRFLEELKKLGYIEK